MLPDIQRVMAVVTRGRGVDPMRGSHGIHATEALCSFVDETCTSHQIEPTRRLAQAEMKDKASEEQTAENKNPSTLNQSKQHNDNEGGGTETKKKDPEDIEDDDNRTTPSATSIIIETINVTSAAKNEVLILDRRTHIQCIQEMCMSKNQVTFFLQN